MTNGPKFYNWSILCPVIAIVTFLFSFIFTFTFTSTTQTLALLQSLACSSSQRHHAHRPSARLRRRQCPLPRQCYRKGWLHSRVGQVARRCPLSRGMSRPITRFKTRPIDMCADADASLETHHPRRRPLWTLPLAARQGRVHCANPRAHQGWQAFHGHLRRHSGAV
jgi:hypothetical protein